MSTLFVGDSLFKYLQVDNADVRSFSGGKTEDLLPLMRDVSDFYNLVVHVGTNDLARRSVVETLDGFEDMLSVIRTRAPSVRIFISNVLPRSFNDFPGAVNSSGRIDGFNVRATNLNAELRKLEDVQVIDHPEFGSSRMDVRRHLLSRDGLHLSPSGLRVLREDLTSAVRRHGSTGRRSTPADVDAPEDRYIGPSFSVEDFPPLPVATHSHTQVTVTPVDVPTPSHTSRDVTSTSHNSQATIATKSPETLTSPTPTHKVTAESVPVPTHSRTDRKVKTQTSRTKVIHTPDGTTIFKRIGQIKPTQAPALRTQPTTSVRPVATKMNTLPTHTQQQNNTDGIGMSKRTTRQSNDWARCSEGFSDFLNSTSNSSIKKNKEKKIQPIKDSFSHGNIFEKLSFQTEESSQGITWSSSDDEQKESSPSVGIFQKFEQKVQSITKTKSVPSGGRKRKKAKSPRAGNVRKRLNRTVDEEVVVVEDEDKIKSDSDTDVITNNLSKSQAPSEAAIKSYDSGTEEDATQNVEPSQVSVNASSPSISDTVSSTSPITQTGAGRKASEWLKTLQLKTPSKSDSKPEIPETEDSAKKKKKHSKGSLADRASRLQARDKSSVRMWSHQQNKLTPSQDTKAILMEVLGFECLYSMQVFRCRTAAREYVGFEPQTSSQQPESRERLVMFPATQAAQLSLQIGTIFKVFPPWQQLELRNGRQILLCTKYCQVISHPSESGEVTTAGTSTGETTLSGATSTKTVTAVWNCPCVQGLCKRQTLCPAYQFPTVPGWIQMPESELATTGSKDGNSNVLKDPAAQSETDKFSHHLHTVSSKAASGSLRGFTEEQVFDSLLESIKKGRSLEAESGDGYAKVPCFKGHVHRAVRYRENTGTYFCRLILEDAVGNVCEVMMNLDELSLLNLDPDHMEGKAFQISGLKVQDRLTREQNPCLFALIDGVWSGRSVKATSQDSDFTQDSPMDRTSCLPAGYCYLLSPDDQQLDGLLFEPLSEPLVPSVDPIYTSLAEIQQTGTHPVRLTCIVKVLFAHKKLTHPKDCVLYVTDPSLEKPHSYVKFVIQSACDFTHDAFAQGSPIKPVYLLRDLYIDKDLVYGDGYTRVTTRKSSIKFSHLEDLEFLHMELPALDLNSETEDLCTVSGCISEVDEDSAYSWESCVRCDSDKLEPLSENSTKCLTCKHFMEEPKTRMKMEIMLRCETVQGLVKIDLLQTTIESLLQQEEADDEGYELSSVLNKDVGALTCMINKLDPDSDHVTVYLKEIELML